MFFALIIILNRTFPTYNIPAKNYKFSPENYNQPQSYMNFSTDLVILT